MGPELLIALIAVNVAVCVAMLCVHAALMRHLREHHHQLEMRFQPRPNPALDANQSEEVEIEAAAALSEYLRGGAWRKLGDVRLERLIRARRLLFYMMCVTTTAFFATLFMSR